MQDPRPASLIFPIRPRLALRRTTSLVLMALASGTALAQESGVATLPTVQVQADGDLTTTEGTGSYTRAPRPPAPVCR